MFHSLVRCLGIFQKSFFDLVWLNIISILCILS